MERDDMMNTMKFDVKADRPMQPREILLTVHHALEEKGYNPINQMVGYVLSGDPSYITSYQGARNLIRKLERDEILEELVTFYVNHRAEGE